MLNEKVRKINKKKLYLGVEIVGDELGGLAGSNIPLPVEEPVGDLELTGVLDAACLPNFRKEV